MSVPGTTKDENGRGEGVRLSWIASGTRSVGGLALSSPQRSLTGEPGGTTNCRRRR
jgi:hypothetical protein